MKALLNGSSPMRGCLMNSLILRKNSMTPMCQLRTVKLYGAKERQTMASSWGLVVIQGWMLKSKSFGH